MVVGNVGGGDAGCCDSKWWCQLAMVMVVMVEVLGGSGC